jgi:hypothetical protein
MSSAPRLTESTPLVKCGIRTARGAKTRRHAAEWVEIMTLGDSLSFLRHDGGELRVTKPAEETFSTVHGHARERDRRGARDRP